MGRTRLLLAAALLLAAIGCSSGDDDDDAGAATTAAEADAVTTTTGAPTVDLAPGDRYVSLGSSIASGFGIPEQSEVCGRSSVSYPQLVAEHYDLQLTDVSCGAAVIPNVLDQPQVDQPPQIEAVTPDTKLVTIAIGGNDIGYNATAILCGDPTNVCSPPADLDAGVAALPGLLTSMLDAVAAAAPDATIVFITYPREFPEGNCPELSYDDVEADTMRSMGETLEQAFVDTVASRDDVVFVDPYADPDDHTACAPESERWTAGHDAPEGTPYHPTALGHEVMADMVINALG